MGSMKSWMFGAVIVAGGLGLGTTPAQAAEFGIHARGPVAYVPPCPGPGYEWVAGYQAGGYWVPGRWFFAGGRDRGRFARFENDRDPYPHFDRHFDRGRERFRR
jgi:hypothetical protein